MTSWEGWGGLPGLQRVQLTKQTAAKSTSTGTFSRCRWLRNHRPWHGILWRRKEKANRSLGNFCSKQPGVGWQGGVTLGQPKGPESPLASSWSSLQAWKSLPSLLSFSGKVAGKGGYWMPGEVELHIFPSGKAASDISFVESRQLNSVK